MTVPIEQLEAQTKGLQRALCARDLQVKKLEEALQLATRASERLHADKDNLAEKVGDSLRQWQVRIDAAEARASAAVDARNKFRLALLRLVSAVEDEKADEDAFWRRVDREMAEAHRLLAIEYRAVSKRSEAA